MRTAQLDSVAQSVCIQASRQEGPRSPRSCEPGRRQQGREGSVLCTCMWSMRPIRPLEIRMWLLIRAKAFTLNGMRIHKDEGVTPSHPFLARKCRIASPLMVMCKRAEPRLNSDSCLQVWLQFSARRDREEPSTNAHDCSFVPDAVPPGPGGLQACQVLFSRSCVPKRGPR